MGEDGMNRRAVAADTNLLRHPTPRRYITAIEALRGHQITILPSVDTKLRRHLPIQAAKHIEQLARTRNLEADPRIAAALREAAGAALEWWETERKRNDSVYAYVSARDDKTYGRIAAELPDEAFTDEHDTDRWIYAEAMVHGVNVLASRNRETIIAEVLQEHFEARGGEPPVTVRSLWEHTSALAAVERPRPDRGTSSSLRAARRAPDTSGLP